MAAALLMGLVIARPQATAGLLARKGLPPTIYAGRVCAVGEAPLAASFANLDEVGAVAPIGALYVDGEAPPAPELAVIAKAGGRLSAQAPARADIVSIGKRNDARGRASWSVTLAPCSGVLVRYDGLETVDAKILNHLTPEFAASDAATAETRIRVKAGEPLGEAGRFTLRAYALPPSPTPAKDVKFSTLALGADAARCPFEFLSKSERPKWTALFGDAAGGRRPELAASCAARAPTKIVGAEGDWLTDSSFGARTNKIADAVLAQDLSDPTRLIFAFYGRLASLDPALFDAPEDAQRRAARGFLSAPRGGDRINAAFHDVAPGGAYCYEGLRAGVDGPRYRGVILLMLTINKTTKAPLMTIEARPAASCAALKTPSTYGGTFTGAETRFYPKSVKATP